MKLRTQLVLAFLLLAVVPLTGVVGYTYLSNVGAMKAALAEDTRDLTAQLERNMNLARSDLRRGLAGMGSGMAPKDRTDSMDDAVRGVIEEAMTAMGSVADSIDRWQFVPGPDAPPPPDSATAVAPPSGAVEAPMPRIARPAVDEEDRRRRAERLAEAHRRIAERIYTVERRRARADADRSSDREWRLRVSEAGEPGEEAAVPSGADGDAPAAGEAAVARPSQEEVEARIEGLTRQLEASSREVEKAAESGDLAALARTGIQAAELAFRRERLERLLGEEMSSSLAGMGELIPEVDIERFMTDVLRRTRREEGEIPYLADSEGNLYTLSTEDYDALLSLVPAKERLLADEDGAGRDGVEELPGWLIARRLDAESGLTFGIARPYGESFDEIRRRTGRNLLLGFGMIGFSLFGIVPLSGRLTRRIRGLSEEAERLAGGDLDARVAVDGRDELGQLAQTFNRMASTLQVNQQQLLEKESENRRQEVERSLLAAENQRRGMELEEARRFQLAMLPDALPSTPEFEFAVYHRTATEVGGDYYDFALRDDSLTIALGDATGHGARAGTLVTVIKTLFLTSGASKGLADFLHDAAGSVRALSLERMAMSLLLVRLSRRSTALSLACAGMPPAYRIRPDGAVEELTCSAVPLGSLARPRYREHRFHLEPGDTLVMLSDGLPEQVDAEGEPVGYRRLAELLGHCGGETPEAIVQRLREELEARTDGRAPSDDVTLLAVRRR